MGVHARLITAASPALPSGAAMGTASQSSRVRELVDRIRTAYHFRKSHNAWAAARFCPMNLGYYPVSRGGSRYRDAARYSLSMRSKASPLPPTGLVLASLHPVEARA